MRLKVFVILIALLPVLWPGLGRAMAPAISAEQLEALMQSEFQFQSGQFSRAFLYYRALPPEQLSVEELWRASQLATVLGESTWLAKAANTPLALDVAPTALIGWRFESALRAGRNDVAQQAWQALLRHSDAQAAVLAQAIVDANAVRYPIILHAILADYAGRTDLTRAERFELFQFAEQWHLEAIADRLQQALPGDSTEAKLVASLRACRTGDVDVCNRRLQALDPLDLSEGQRRRMLTVAQQRGTVAQHLRWLVSLPQDAGTYYQRIILLGQEMEDVQAQALLAQIHKDPALDDFQRALLLGSLSELRKDWPAAEAHYRDALVAGVPTTASIRLAVVLFRQGKRDAAFAQLQATAADTQLSDELRRDALQTEIQFHRILRSDMRDPEVLNAVYRRALVLWPYASAWRYPYAMRLFEQNRIDQAMSELQALLQVTPGDADALNAYGYTLAKTMNQPRAALKPMTQAFFLAPGRPDILDSYGYVLYRLGREREALVPLQKAWSLAPSAVTAGHLGQVLLRLGEHQQARDYLEKGLELDATETELLTLREQLR